MVRYSTSPTSMRSSYCDTSSRFSSPVRQRRRGAGLLDASDGDRRDLRENADRSKLPRDRGEPGDAKPFPCELSPGGSPDAPCSPPMASAKCECKEGPPLNASGVPLPMTMLHVSPSSLQKTLGFASRRAPGSGSWVSRSTSHDFTGSKLSALKTLTFITRSVLSTRNESTPGRTRTMTHKMGYSRRPTCPPAGRLSPRLICMSPMRWSKTPPAMPRACRMGRRRQK
mmetsp:Transcript_688/g.2754  ORF Transcript_688/g.2754 Transcript_688/m.2754 type:complete len:227 (-) Transcript_688:10242-10922(-)